MNFVQIDGLSFSQRKRKLVSGACIRCHERKVKCNAGSSTEALLLPCRNCVASGHADNCRAHVDGRSKASSKHAATQATQTSNTSTFPEDEPWNQYQQVPEPSSGINYHLTPESLSSMGDGQPPNLDYSFTARESHEDSISRQAAQDLGPCLPDDFVEPALALEQPRHHADVSEALYGRSPYGKASFSRRYPNSEMERPHLPLDRFEAYVKDTLGSFAPSFRKTQGQEQDAEDRRRGISSGNSETLPRDVLDPSQRRLEVNMASRSTINWEAQFIKLDFADTEYLGAKGAFDLAPRNVQQDLIDSFFNDIHPTVPVINRTEFLSQFHSEKGVSRLLLFAIFTSGSRACRNPWLLDSKGTNQESAQQFYQATKALLDTGYESDRLVRIQSLLLLTWWWDKKDDGGRNMRSCLADSISTAHSMGMHRWNQYPKDDIVLTRIWKRVWWTCFNRDAVVSSSHGLPCLLSPDEFDVHPLTPDDFNEEPETPLSLQNQPPQPEETAFSIEVVKVSEALHHIHKSHFVAKQLQLSLTKTIAGRASQLALSRQPSARNGAAVGMSDAVADLLTAAAGPFEDEGLRLCREWLDNLPHIARYDIDDVKNHRFWPSFLHILYLTAIMLHFRDKAVASPTKGRAEAERLFAQSRGIAAATMISKILRNARAHNHISRFTGQLTMTLFNCLVYFLIEGQSSIDDIRRDAQSKYSMCLHILYEFSQLWVSAALIHQLFETLQAQMQFPGSSRSSPHAPPPSWKPLPGLKVSSDISTAYFTDLINENFHDTASVGELQSGNGSSSAVLPANIGLDPFMLDDLSGSAQQYGLPQGGGLPRSLDADEWLDFFVSWR